MNTRAERRWIASALLLGLGARANAQGLVQKLMAPDGRPLDLFGAMFINDPFVMGGPAGRRELWGTTHLGHHVSVGTNATLMPVSICDHVVIGAGAVVTKDIKEPGIYAGNPARLLRRLNEVKRGPTEP